MEPAEQRLAEIKEFKDIDKWGTSLDNRDKNAIYAQEAKHAGKYVIEDEKCVLEAREKGYTPST